MQTYIVETSYKVYCKAEVKARSVDEAWLLANDKILSGELGEEFFRDSDMEIDGIEEKHDNGRQKGRKDK